MMTVYQFCKYIRIILLVPIIICTLSCYQDHRGFQLTSDELVQLKKIAEQGDAEACWCLYRYYEEDEEDSTYWLRKGSILGDPRAQYLLASTLLNSKPSDADVNSKEALILLRKAADQNEIIAQKVLGDYYYQGKFVARDWKQSEYWYRRSATNGCVTAILPLSIVLTDNNNFNGLVEAYKWTVIDLSRNSQQISYNNKIKQQQLLIIEKAKKLGFDVSLLKQTATAQAAKDEKKIKQDNWGPDPLLGTRCGAKGNRGEDRGTLDDNRRQ